MAYDPDLKVALRYLDAIPSPLDGESGFVLHDPTGLASSPIAVSEPGLFILAHFDGRNSCADVREAFHNQFGQELPEATLAGLIESLKQARLLAGDDFERFYASLVDAYRSASVRPMRGLAELGLGDDVSRSIAEMLSANAAGEVTVDGTIVGLVAPHLDYQRGGHCYAAAYACLMDQPPPTRVVILGTNHFGRGQSVVATGKPFATPLGTTANDEDFLEAIEAQCGDLRVHEFDHQREHSVELQVLICQHIWGAGAFQIVPFLCPNPCAPTESESGNNVHVELRRFADSLRDVIASSDGDTLIIAGADLSHVGASFGDDELLDDRFAGRVEQRDRLALARLENGDPEAFRAQIAADQNPTRVCSAGCIFAAATALNDARFRLIRYHQAINENRDTGVTCAAGAFICA